MRIWLVFILPLAAGFINPVLYPIILISLIWAFHDNLAAVLGKLLLMTTMLCAAVGSLPVFLMLIALNRRGEKEFDLPQLGELQTLEQVLLVAGYGLLVILVMYWLYEMIRLFWNFRQGDEYIPHIVRYLGFSSPPVDSHRA